MPGSLKFLTRASLPWRIVTWDCQIIKFTIAFVELFLSEYFSKATRTDSKTEIGTKSGLPAVINLAMWFFPSFEVFYS